MSTTSPTPGPPPIPAPKAPPAQLSPGTLVAERFEIEEPLGTSELATSYLATDTAELERPRVSLKFVEASRTDLFRSCEPTLEMASRCRHKSLSQLLAWGLHEDLPYFALEFLKGQTLKQVIERKQQNRSRFSPRTALSLVTPVCHALAAVHERVHHGALTPQNVYVERNGRVRLANLGFGWFIERALAEQGLGSAADSPFIPPEVRRDPTTANAQSDLFGLGMITICLLAGRHPSKDAASDLTEHLLEGVPPSLRDLLSASISALPSDRPQSVAAFFEPLKEAIEDLRDQIISTTREHDIPETNDLGLADRPTGLSPLLSTDELPPIPEGGDDPAVWLVHRDGFDFGPFSSEQVREQLLQDAIDEHTEVRNLETQVRGTLGDMDEFAEFMADYIPIRDERRRREEQRRQEVQRKVKRAGATGVITVIVGILGLVGLYVYYAAFIQAKPEPIVIESLFARVGRDLRPPAQSYVGISADPELMAALFNFEEEIEEAPRHHRRHSNGEQGSDVPLPTDLNGDPLDRGTVDFTRSAGNRRLTSSDINDTILREGRPIQRCLRAEVSRNRSFSGTEMRFVVRPDGRTQGVDMGSGNYTEELRSCLTPIFRQMRFPQHDGLNLPVSFPFNVRR